jgi:hypothetical protein
MLHSLATSRAGDQALAWLLTYAVHSTLLLALAWAVSRRMGARWLRLQETIWRCALAGALVTATAQLAFGSLGHAPMAGRWTLVSPPAPARAASAAAGAGFAAATGSAGNAAGEAHRRVDLTGREQRGSREQPAPRLHGLHREQAAALGAPAAGALGSVESAWLTPLRPLLLPAWVLGALTLCFGTVRSYLSLRRRLRYRPQVVGGGVLARLAVLVRVSGISRRVRLTCTWRLRVPVALGLRTAEVCVPPRVFFQLDDEQQDALLAHELAHLVRRDPVWLPLTQLVAGVFFFQPLNWLARRRLRELSELLCDEWAVARTGRPLSLAACLAEVASWSLAAVGALAADTARRQPARLPVPGMADRPSQLAHRIRRLLDGAPPDGREPGGRRLAIVLATVLLAVTLAAPGIDAGSSAAPPTLAAAGGGMPAYTPRTSPVPHVPHTPHVLPALMLPGGAAPGRAPFRGWPAAHGSMIVVAMAPMTPAVDQGPEAALATAPEAAPVPAPAPAPSPKPASPSAAAASPVTASEPPVAAELAAAPDLDAERERLGAAAVRLEQLDKISTLSQAQIEAITASVERISREIDGRLGEELERLNHQLAAVRAAAPHREHLPAAERAKLDAELAEMTAKLHPSAKEMAELEAELHKLAAELPHISAEEMKRFQEEAKHALEQMPKVGLSQAEIDRLHAELGRALAQMPKAGLTQAEIEHLRADVGRIVEESAAAASRGLSRAEREKLTAEARRLAEQLRPDQAQLEALRALQGEHEELARVLARQRAEIEAVRREVLEQTEALRDQARRLSESHRLHPKARSDRHAPPAPAAPAPPRGPAATAPPAPAPAAAPPPVPAPADGALPPPPDSAGPPPPGACRS